MARKLYMCVVQNHPWAAQYSYWEEEYGMVQKVKMRKEGNTLHFDGYEGLMFRFAEIEDACVLVDYQAGNADEVGVLSSKVKRRNFAEQNDFWDEEAIDNP